MHFPDSQLFIATSTHSFLPLSDQKTVYLVKCSSPEERPSTKQSIVLCRFSFHKRDIFAKERGGSRTGQILGWSAISGVRP